MQSYQNRVVALPPRTRLARPARRDRTPLYGPSDWWTAKGKQKQVYVDKGFHRWWKDETENPEGYSVYFLREPRTGRVRYIGLSSTPATRIPCHKNQGPCRDWWRELDRQGLQPDVHIVLRGLSYAQGEAAEERLIAMHNLAFPGRLLNKNNRVVSFFGKLSPISKIFLEGGLILSPISDKP